MAADVETEIITDESYKILGAENYDAAVAAEFVAAEPAESAAGDGSVGGHDSAPGNGDASGGQLT